MDVELPIVEAREAPARSPFPPAIEVLRADTCINCGECIRGCIYGVHERGADDPRVLAEPHHADCRSCWVCVQVCPKQALQLVPSTGREGRGRGPFDVEVISTLQKQATDGKIPVSGCGYEGRFRGQGFDGFWTDMSEIVRPTRDGIHGREHIGTSVQLGRKLRHLAEARFDQRGGLLSRLPPVIEVHLPWLFNRLPYGPRTAGLARALVQAAAELGTLAILDVDAVGPELEAYAHRTGARIVDHSAAALAAAARRFALLELDWHEGIADAIATVKASNGNCLVMVRFALDLDRLDDMVALAREGGEILHLAADLEGRGPSGALPDVLPQIHQRLVAQGVREQVSLVASGGIAEAAHVAKAILLGADALMVDTPLLIALECDLCEGYPDCAGCHAGVGEQPVEWAVQRLHNLSMAWKNQLLEVLGAMGLREVARLRGERGRAIFADQMESELFAPLFARAERPSEPTPAVAAAVGKPLATRGGLRPATPGTGVTSRPTGETDQALGPPDVDRGPAQVASTLINAVPRWRVTRDLDACIHCGTCTFACPTGAHVREPGTVMMAPPLNALCLGPECAEQEASCVGQCPTRSLGVAADPQAELVGDRRWTWDVLKNSYDLAETGLATPATLDPDGGRGDSRGGFDRMRIHVPRGSVAVDPEDVDLSLVLNRRGDEAGQVELGIPFYGGAMSFGSISLDFMLARARAAKRLDTLTCTGEGGFPDELFGYGPWIITQIATGLFGVREETIRLARVVEFKYAQGAKPGLGGHLLGKKNTPPVARLREAVPYTNLFSPFPFHSVYSIEDHKKHIDWVKTIHPEAVISVKVATPGDVDMVAVGIYYAGAHVIHLDGGYGGTGAAPNIAKKNIAMPIEYGLPRTHQFLVQEGVRDEVTLIASGGIRTVQDIVKTLCLGADGIVLGTSEKVAIDCVRCRNCEIGRGCPRGIASTDPELMPYVQVDWAEQRIVNVYSGLAAQLRQWLARLGLRSVRELTGRTDLIDHLDYLQPACAECGE